MIFLNAYLKYGAIFIPKPIRMKQLSQWASRHVRTSRMLVAGCYLMINILGILLSVFLLGGTSPATASWLIAIALAISTGALIWYPAGATQPGRYLRRKICDVALCSATLLFVTGNAATQVQPVSRSHALSKYVPPTGMQGTGQETYRTHLTKKTEGVSYRLHQLQSWYKTQSEGVKVLLIVLTVLATIGLIWVWAAVCCGIACNGMEVLAYALFFGGAAAAIFGCVRVIRRIVRGTWRKGK